MRRLLASTAALVVGLSAAPAGAGPELGRAKAALEDLRYEDAAQALDEALQAGDQKPDDVREIYRLLGEVSAALGDRDAAVDHFEHLLSLDPDATLREGVSPKIAEPFDAARARVRSRKPLGLRCEIGEDAVDVTVTADPLAMAHGAYQAGTGGYETAEIDGRHAVIVVTDARLVDEVGLLDEHGNRLVAVPVGKCKRAKPALPPRHQHKSSAGGGRSIFGHWALWGGVAVGFAAAGGYFGLQARDEMNQLAEVIADSSAHEYSEAQALEHDARRDALVANIGFGAAGVAAIVAGVMLYRSASASSERQPAADGVVVTPTVGSAGFGVAVAVPF